MIRNDADLIVVGGGAAGLYAAAIAARRGLRVLILEKCPRPARKLMITGKGRCNVTNNTTKEKLMENIPCNPKFLYSAFASCDAQDVMRFFEAQGVELKTERGNRVFPVSDKAVDIVDALVGACKTAGAKLLTDTPVQSLVIEDGVLNGVKTETKIESKVLLSAAVDAKRTVGTKFTAPQAVKTSADVKSVSTLKPNAPIELDANGVPVKYTKKITSRATAYTYTGNNCSTGVAPQPGYIAVNPNYIPYGTRMYIKTVDGRYIYGYAVAADTGGFIKRHPTGVDLFMSSESACRAFGVRTVEIYILP